jgi:uncharacterized protein (DUF433 family)
LSVQQNIVISDPEIMRGTPVYRGTRIPVELIADMLTQGARPEEILEGYPALDREKVELAPLYVQAFPRRGRPAPRPWARQKPIRATRHGRAPCGGTVKLLIDECLHTSLVELAHAAGHVADHVNYLGLGSSKDWQLMATIRAAGLHVCNEQSFRLSCSPWTRTVASWSDHYCSQCHASSSARTLQRGAQTYRCKRSDQYCS